MNFKKLPSTEYLHECFYYNEITGVLHWKERPLNHFVSKKGQAITNGKYAGKKAGTIAKDGYIYICLEGANNKRLAQRIIWKMVYGEEPEEFIDHADGNKLNNKIGNLRNATKSETLCNREKNTRKSSKSKLKGVSLDTRSKEKSYYATVYKNKKRVFYKRFNTELEAYEAYKAKAIEHHGIFARLI